MQEILEFGKRRLGNLDLGDLDVRNLDVGDLGRRGDSRGKRHLGGVKRHLLQRRHIQRWHRGEVDGDRRYLEDRDVPDDTLPSAIAVGGRHRDLSGVDHRKRTLIRVIGRGDGPSRLRLVVSEHDLDLVRIGDPPGHHPARLPVRPAHDDRGHQLGVLDHRRGDPHIGDPFQVAVEFPGRRPLARNTRQRPPEKFQAVSVQDPLEPLHVLRRGGAFSRLQATDDRQPELVHIGPMILLPLRFGALALRRIPVGRVRLVTGPVGQAGRIIAVKEHQPRRIERERRIRVTEVAHYPVLLVQHGKGESQLRHEQQTVSQGDRGHDRLDPHLLPVGLGPGQPVERPQPSRGPAGVPNEVRRGQRHQEPAYLMDGLAARLVCPFLFDDLPRPGEILVDLRTHARVLRGHRPAKLHGCLSRGPGRGIRLSPRTRLVVLVFLIRKRCRRIGPHRVAVHLVHRAEFTLGHADEFRQFRLKPHEPLPHPARRRIARWRSPRGAGQATPAEIQGRVGSGRSWTGAPTAPLLLLLITDRMMISISPVSASANESCCA